MTGSIPRDLAIPCVVEAYDERLEEIENLQHQIETLREENEKLRRELDKVTNLYTASY